MLKAAAAIAALTLAFAAAVIWTRYGPRGEGLDVRGSSTAEFTIPTTPAPSPGRARNRIVWSQFGGGPARRHVALEGAVRPPFRVAWVAGGRRLLEFPPVLGFGRLFLLDDGGRLRAISVETGAVAWSFDSGRGSASSPALGADQHGTLYAAFLNRRGTHGKSATDGEVVALAAGWGAVRWRRRIGASETSPLLVDGRVYVGDWAGDVHALAAANGRVLWTFHTGGAVKGGATASGRTVVVGSYDGHVYALDARSGRVVWSATGERPGTFYSTPAAAYGRIYIGSTNGDVYSFGAKTGTLRWSYHTSGYVYGSPAVWNGLVYVGSYDGEMYAFDAATGAAVWRYRAAGRISGSATVVNGIVYFATVAGRTYGLNARTGVLTWSYAGGRYTPVVADRSTLYLLAHANVYALLPRSPRS